MKTAVHFSSATDLHATPQSYFDEINTEFGGFILDVCATHENAKCAWYFTEDEDGLQQNWDTAGLGPVWMNPPYGRGIGAWVKKAHETALTGTTVVALLPARTDTAWFQDYCIPFGEIRFIRGRLKFGGALNSAPFPSALVIFRAQ
jgi:phage N-6-adenine-methyltransferase